MAAQRAKRTAVMETVAMDPALQVCPTAQEVLSSAQATSTFGNIAFIIVHPSGLTQLPVVMSNDIAPLGSVGSKTSPFLTFIVMQEEPASSPVAVTQFSVKVP
jgi:hypothetical protein